MMKNRFPKGWDEKRVKALIACYEERPHMVQLAVDRNAVASVCRKHGIKRLAVFGSALRHDFRPDSDLDILVEFLPGKTPGFAFFDIQEELSILVGRKVDLNTPEDLPRRIRAEIQQASEVLYEQP